MEYLDTLLVISLHGDPREEHMGDFTKGQGSMWVDEDNFGWGHIHIPLSKVRTHQHQKIYDVGEREWNRRQKDRVETHAFQNILPCGIVLVNLSDDKLFKC